MSYRLSILPRAAEDVQSIGSSRIIVAEAVSPGLSAVILKAHSPQMVGGHTAPLPTSLHGDVPTYGWWESIFHGTADIASKVTWRGQRCWIRIRAQLSAATTCWASRPVDAHLRQMRDDPTHPRNRRIHQPASSEPTPSLLKPPLDRHWKCRDQKSWAVF